MDAAGVDVGWAGLAACVSAAYLPAGGQRYFALGFGVAGAFTGGRGVLPANNPNDRVLSDGKGIDRLDDSPIGAALFGAAASCGITFSHS